MAAFSHRLAVGLGLAVDFNYGNLEKRGLTTDLSNADTKVDPDSDSDSAADTRRQSVRGQIQK